MKNDAASESNPMASAKRGASAGAQSEALWRRGSTLKELYRVSNQLSPLFDLEVSD